MKSSPDAIFSAIALPLESLQKKKTLFSTAEVLPAFKQHFESSNIRGHFLRAETHEEKTRGTAFAAPSLLGGISQKKLTPDIRPQATTLETVTKWIAVLLLIVTLLTMIAGLVFNVALFALMWKFLVAFF